MSDHVSAATTGSVDVLRQLKEVEEGCDARLAAAKSKVESTLTALSSAAEESVRAARAEADRKREETLKDARAAAETESTRIVAEGKRAADGLSALTPKALEAKREEILTAVLRGFRSKGGSK